MSILNPEQRRLGGFTLGSPDNLFGQTSGDASVSPLSVLPATDIASARSTRDTYFTNNPSKLTQYDNNPSLSIYIYYQDSGNNIVLGESRVGGVWVPNNSITAIQGQSGTDGVSYEFANISERDTFFSSRPDLLREGMPITITVAEDTVSNQVWVGPTSPVNYNPPTDAVLWVEASLRAGTASFELGDIHKMSSGGENVFFINQGSEIAFFPTWQGHGNHENPVTRTVDSRPYSRTYDVYQTLETGGVVAPSGSVDYDIAFTLTVNECVYGIKTIAAETYTGELEYRRLSASGKEVYSQKQDFTIIAGDVVEFWFEYPVENLSGQSFTTKIMKPNGDPLLVRPTLAVATDPYVEIRYREFEDKIMMIEEDHQIMHKNSNFVAENCQTYAVDTRFNTVSVDASSPDLHTFTIFDSHEEFNDNSCFVNFGGGTGTFELDTRNDYFRFYKNSSGVWRFQDIDQDDTGNV